MALAELTKNGFIGIPRKNPQRETPSIGLPACLDSEGDIPTGADELSQTSLLKPENIDSVILRIGKVMLQTGQREIAQQIANIAMKKHPFDRMSEIPLAAGQEFMIPK